MTKEQCPYVSPQDGERCRYFASDHRAHLIPATDAERRKPLAASPEDDAGFDPEGINARMDAYFADVKAHAETVMRRRHRG